MSNAAAPRAERTTDPTEMTPADFAAFGIERISRGSAVRKMCLSCMGGSPMEVRLCASAQCPLWPFRMGTDPWRAPMSEDRRQAASERFKAMHAKGAADE